MSCAPNYISCAQDNMSCARHIFFLRVLNIPPYRSPNSKRKYWILFIVFGRLSDYQAVVYPVAKMLIYCCYGNDIIILRNMTAVKDWNITDIKPYSIKQLIFQTVYENFHSFFHFSQILTFARHSWPLSSEGSLECHTYCDTGHPFIMVISEDPWTYT